jgi:hypothetical protein
LLSDGRKGGRADGSLSRGAEEGSLEHCDVECGERDGGGWQELGQRRKMKAM